MKKAVIFDMDGLMFNTEKVYAYAHEQMFLKRGLVYTPEIKSHLIGRKTIEIMDFYAKEIFKTGETAEELLKEQDSFLPDGYKNTATMCAGLNEILEFLEKNNIRKAIGTTARKHNVEILLDKFNMRDRFEVIITGDMVKNGKPAPDIYLKVLEELKLNGDECIVLEDAPNGIKSAQTAGCIPVAIPNEHTKHLDFPETKFIFSSLDDPKLFEVILN